MKSRTKTDIRKRHKRASDIRTNDIMNKFNNVIGLSASSSDKKTNNKNEISLGAITMIRIRIIIIIILMIIINLFR